MLTSILAAAGGFNWNSVFEDKRTVWLALAFCFGVLVMVGYLWHVNQDRRLKVRMVERGFSAEEIERVMQAGRAKEELETPHPRPASNARPTPSE